MGTIRKVLFLDDRGGRVRSAIKKYNPATGYALTIVTTVKECIKMLSDKKWDLVSLDHDLGYEEMQPSFRPDCGMEVVRWIVDNQEFLRRDMGYFPFFIVHSTNQAASFNMVESLNVHLYPEAAFHYPWEFPKYYHSVTHGAFDIIHPEYIRLFKFAKDISSFLTVALNVEPKGKSKPVLSADEREEMLLAIRWVDRVVRYETEEELTNILSQMAIEFSQHGGLVRVMGDDHKGKSSREDLGIPCEYKPYGDWSATKLKKLYGESVK